MLPSVHRVLGVAPQRSQHHISDAGSVGGHLFSLNQHEEGTPLVPRTIPTPPHRRAFHHAFPHGSPDAAGYPAVGVHDNRTTDGPRVYAIAGAVRVYNRHHQEKRIMSVIQSYRLLQHHPTRPFTMHTLLESTTTEPRTAPAFTPSQGPSATHRRRTSSIDGRLASAPRQVPHLP